MNEKEYLSDRLCGWIEYQYLYKDGEWHAYRVDNEEVPSVYMGVVKDIINNVMIDIPDSLI